MNTKQRILSCLVIIFINVCVFGIVRSQDQPPTDQTQEAEKTELSPAANENTTAAGETPVTQIPTPGSQTTGDENQSLAGFFLAIVTLAVGAILFVAYQLMKRQPAASPQPSDAIRPPPASTPVISAPPQRTPPSVVNPPQPATIIDAGITPEEQQEIQFLYEVYKACEKIYNRTLIPTKAMVEQAAKMNSPWSTAEVEKLIYKLSSKYPSKVKLGQARDVGDTVKIDL